ncbi:MAG: hypothetical protein IKQ69_04285 [Oscillospiraceae bacterium]|nr:hypothetical protein [Oscillospiraceae bacterium]
MEQIKTKNEQKLLMDEIDYIDIPAFIRSFLRYTRKFILFALPLILCMSVCLALLSKPYAKKNDVTSYVAGGTAMIGVRLSNSVSFDYTLSGLSWDRQATLAQMGHVLSVLMESGYIDQFVRNSMGIDRNDELNGQIYMNAAYMTNLVDIYVVSESPEDAESIRDAVFSCLPDAVFPAVGFIEVDIEELYTREQAPSRAFLNSQKVWAAGGAVLGLIGYLGLVFLYTLRRRDVETPKDIRKLTDLPCLGRLPALRKRLHLRKQVSTGELNDSLVVTEAYRRAFDRFRRAAAEEIQQQKSRVILLTGNGQRKGQSTIAAELEKAWNKMGKKVILADPALKEGGLTEEQVRRSLDQSLREADLVLVDGPPCDRSADSLVLADCADAMILVIREGQSQPEELRELFQSLQYANARPLGYVLNICSHTAV